MNPEFVKKIIQLGEEMEKITKEGEEITTRMKKFTVLRNTEKFVDEQKKRK